MTDAGVQEDRRMAGSAKRRNDGVESSVASTPSWSSALINYIAVKSNGPKAHTSVMQSHPPYPFPLYIGKNTTRLASMHAGESRRNMADPSLRRKG